jgi:hypothetical protein
VALVAGERGRGLGAAQRRTAQVPHEPPVVVPARERVEVAVPEAAQAQPLGLDDEAQ